MQSWIFQGNPKIYDLAAAVRALKEETWLVQQHRNDIRLGDCVYLWESGPDAGMVAVAEVLDEVSDRPFGESGKRFILDQNKLGGIQPRVLIRITRVIDPRLSRITIKAQPGLSGLSILKQAQGTNFAVTPEEAKLIEKLLDT